MPAAVPQGRQGPTRLWALARCLAPVLPLCACAQTVADCPVVPDPVDFIRSENIYGPNSQRDSGVDEAALAKRAELVRPVSEFVETVTRQADAYHTRGDVAGARCALQSLAQWARAGAMLKASPNEAGRKEVIWNTAGLALAYLRLKPASSPPESSVVEVWLSRLGVMVVDQYGLSRSQGNVHAWVGLTGIAVGACCGQPALASKGAAMQASVLAGVTADGVLPVELDRGRRALSYHYFAAAPLLAGAVVATRHGHPPSESSRAALKRLVSFTLRATESRSILERMTGRKMDEPSERMRAVVIALSGTAAAGSSSRPRAFERWLGGSAGYFID